MATTTVQALPYPALGDAANGPVAFQNLAQAVEKKLVMSFATVAARSAALPAPAEGALAYVTELDTLTVFQDGTWFAVGAVTPTSVNAPAATAAPSTYPYGVQSRWVSGDATWPNANGVVFTERTSDTRCWQTFRASQTTVPGMWVRRANLAAGPWSSWDYFAPWSDTGWQNGTYSAGYTTQTGPALRSRILNGVVHIDGLIRRTDSAVWAANSNFVVGTLFAGHAPNNGKFFQVAGNGGNADARLLVGSDHTLTIATGSSPSTYYSVQVSFADG